MTAVMSALRAHAASHPERLVLDPCGEPAVSWGQLPALVEGRAAQLTSEFDTVRPVAVQLDYSPGAAALELALLETGIPVLSLPAFFTAEQRQHALTSCGAQAVFESCPLEAIRCSRTAPVLLPGGTARITFTSGSTGTPKGVCLSAPHMLTVAGSVVAAIGAEHAGRHLAVLPPGILLEFVAGFLPTLLAGGTYVCPPQERIGLADPFKPDFARLLQAIKEWRITSLILVPEYLSGLVAAMEASAARLPLLTLVAVGGARTPPALLERARLLGLPVRQGYGLTECASVVALDDGTGDAGSVGTALGHVRVSIAPDGEILLDGPLHLGTIGVPRPPGPLATGDLGRIDAAGKLWMEGRKSSLFVTSFGRNISPEWIEEALLAQPEIMQAMAYGEGMAKPGALLTPSSAEADLAAAVARANAMLPAYAQVIEWREVAHFMPMNGLLTGNGRLRRDRIAATWLEGSTCFFAELEAATTRERMRFMQVPQLQAGLNGSIGRSAYVAYLEQAYHHVKHTVPLLEAARDKLAHRADLAAALNDYVEEETGHEEWILSDIAAAGGNAKAVRAGQPAPATRAMVEHAYARIREGNPVSFFGMVYVLESVSVALATRGADAVAENLGLPPEAFTYLTSHGALDQEHMHFFAGLVNGLGEEADRQAIVGMAKEVFGLYGAVFASVDLENPGVAA
jgi:acyl-CoA synthetase (AMP-forming)/AMP-acid ligase II/pyrroloquinoline quinone (PQQ) biosynthesis protein C